jgi:hypothetical protein
MTMISILSWLSAPAALLPGGLLETCTDNVRLNDGQAATRVMVVRRVKLGPRRDRGEECACVRELMGKVNAE